MKRLLTLFACLGLLLVVVVGCSDDDCPTCSDTNPLGFAHGSFYLDPEAYADEFLIFGYGAIPPNIDSMKLGDSLLVGEDFFDYDYDEEYHENWWEVYFSEDGTNYMYEHGDMATVQFFGEGRSSTCTFKILDADSAEIDIISPDYNVDTLTGPTEFEIVWEKSDGADYYSVWIEFGFGNSWDYHYHYDYSTDTTFTVTTEMYPDSVRAVYLNITPFTGPDPASDVGNITGDFLTGKVYGFGWYGYSRVEGWYDPPVTVGTAKLAEPTRIKVHPSEIINKTYENISK